MPNSWKVTGSYFETCNCDLACPCVFLSPPTSGNCTVLLAWHIDQGRFDEVNLDGFNTALAAYAPGHMLEVKWKVALYVDERASQDQQDALTKIFSGQAGGHLADLARSSAKFSGLRQHRSNIVLKENDGAFVSVASPMQRLRGCRGKMVVM